MFIGGAAVGQGFFFLPFPPPFRSYLFWPYGTHRFIFCWSAVLPRPATAPPTLGGGPCLCRQRGYVLVFCGSWGRVVAQVSCAPVRRSSSAVAHSGPPPAYRPPALFQSSGWGGGTWPAKSLGLGALSFGVPACGIVSLRSSPFVGGRPPTSPPS